MKKNRLLLLGILLLGVGFALVSTTLLITGNVKIATNNANFDVKFTKAALDGTDISETAIKENGKKITFETKNLITVGNISKLDFEVTNNSEMYDAEVSIDCTAAGEKSSYYHITKKVASPIAGKTTESGKVEVSLLKAPVDDIHEEFTCTLTATARERTKKAEPPQIYYAFGDPLTAADRTTEYATLKYTGTETPALVFAKSEGNKKSICTMATGSLECFRGGTTTAYVEEEKEHLKRVFAEGSCSSPESSPFYCSHGTFYCDMYSDGYVRCYDLAASLYCDIDSVGNIYCGS